MNSLLLLALLFGSLCAQDDDNTSESIDASTWINRLFMSQEELEGKEPEPVESFSESLGKLFEVREED